MTSITIPNSVTSILDYAFSGCSSLSSVTIPDNLTNIAAFAFLQPRRGTSLSEMGPSVLWGATGFVLLTEMQLLDLEREAFLKLCGERKTLERIQYTLKTGKTLRN